MLGAERNGTGNKQYVSGIKAVVHRAAHNIPTVGTKYSHGGNVSFPPWEYSLFHAPMTVVLDHRHNDFLLRGIAVAEDEEDVGVA